MASAIIFHFHYAGPAGVGPIIALGLISYMAGLIRNRAIITAAIAANIAALFLYKYLVFFFYSSLYLFNSDAAQHASRYISDNILPSQPPLAISFFVFEFVHYLFDVAQNKPSIRSPVRFILFSLFWPTLVAGPIKRYESFLPLLEKAVRRRVAGEDFVWGCARVSLGFVKKVASDNLTLWIVRYDSSFSSLTFGDKWLLFVAIGFRILLDFSGYSDMAIGFATMMGIRLPENFRWPYLARSPGEFWRRWHISLSSWVRDYVYIPLGGNRHGSARRGFNALVAFSLVGLWHGAGWNFVLWGVYHGLARLIHEGAWRVVADVA